MDEEEEKLPAYTDEERFYVPLDALIEAIGGTYRYDEEEKMVSIELGAVQGGNSTQEAGAVTEEVFENSKQAYEKLVEASEKGMKILDDIYAAWFYGIYEDDNASFSDFCGSLYVSSSDVEQGIKDYDTTYYIISTEEDYKEYRTFSKFFSLESYGDDFWSDCVRYVLYAYRTNGVMMR